MLSNPNPVQREIVGQAADMNGLVQIKGYLSGGRSFDAGSGHGLTCQAVKEAALANAGAAKKGRYQRTVGARLEERSRIAGFKRVNLANILRVKPVLIHRALTPIEGALEKFIESVWHVFWQTWALNGVGQAAEVQNEEEWITGRGSAQFKRGLIERIGRYPHKT